MQRINAGRILAEVETRDVAVTVGLRRALRLELGRFAGQFPDLQGRLQVRLFAAAKGGSAPCRGCLLVARLGRARRAAVASSVDTDLHRAVRAAFAGLVRAARRTLGLARVAHRARNPI